MVSAVVFWAALVVCLGTVELKNVPTGRNLPFREKAQDVQQDKIDAKQDPKDIWDDTCMVALKRGYPCETHSVVTEDGYILNMHRIPWGKDGKTAGVRPAVNLQHGLMSSSEDWVISPPGQALAFLLSDAGYDVWMGNYRGNYYSTGHTTIDPKDHEFWHFSWDQMGKYDLPAMYDHMLAATGQEKIIHIGHSMGTTAFWVAMNERPEYNDKISAMFALAPVASVDNMKSPLHLIAPMVDQVEWLLDNMGSGEFLPSTKFLNWLGSIVCDDSDVWIAPICESVLFILGGYDQEKFNMTMLSTIVGSPGRGTSVRTIAQYAQGVNNKKFCKYDYGTEGNMEHYGQDTPPEYDLKKVTAPVMLLWGENDWLGDPADVMEIVSGLPNLMPGGVIDVDFPKWNHLDFLWGMDAKPLVYDHVMDAMSKLKN